MTDPADNPEDGPHSADPATALPDALRLAVSRTLEATSAPASETRQRAAELLDEVARRGQEAGEEIARRGNIAREEFRRRLREVGFAGAEDHEALVRRVAELEARVAELESADDDQG